MTPEQIFSLYSREIMSFNFTDAPPAELPEAPDKEFRQKKCAEVSRLYRASGRKRLLVFGLGSGAFILDLLREIGPERLLLIELSPDLVRRFWSEKNNAPELEGLAVLCDSSFWSLLYMLHLHLVAPGDSLSVMNPELPQKTEKFASLVRLRRIWRNAEVKNLTLAAPDSCAGKAKADISLAAILSPAEPDMPSFWKQIPFWLKEVVIVWDGRAGEVMREDLPVRQEVRRLNGDFAAQRQAALALCRAEWVFFLDADERLEEKSWHGLAAATLSGQMDALWLPRMTLYPDTGHCQAGYGLWPDLQLRLFRRQAGLHFTQPVHERLQGLEGINGLALDWPIIHLNRLLKSDKEVRAKLKVFDSAAGVNNVHTLNEDYPSLPRSFMQTKADENRIIYIPDINLTSV